MPSIVFFKTSFFDLFQAGDTLKAVRVYQNLRFYDINKIIWKVVNKDPDKGFRTMANHLEKIDCGNPEDFSGSPTDAVRQLYDLKLFKYQQEQQWQDFWENDWQRLQSNLNTLHCDLVQPLDASDVEKKTHELELMDETGDLTDQEARLLLVLNLVSHRHQRTETETSINLLNCQVYELEQALKGAQIELVEAFTQPEFELLTKHLWKIERKLVKILRFCQIDAAKWAEYKHEYAKLLGQYDENIKVLSLSIKH